MSTAAVAVTNASIQQSGENASDELKRQLAGAILGVAKTKNEFTTDDVWAEFERRGGTSYLSAAERSVLGYVIRQGVRLGYINASQKARRSKRPSSHRRLLTVFVSNQTALSDIQEGRNYVS